jgi:DNA-binding CsgD family transcriptional regulator
LRSGGTLSVTRRSKPPLELVVAPLAPGRDGDWPAGELALLIVNDPSSQPEGIIPFLVRRFDLTPGEARVALTLMSGIGVKEAAEQLGVSGNTVRTHLQRIFDKTATKRQAELVRLLCSHPALALLARGE